VKVALTFDAEHPDRPRCDPGVPAAVVDLLREKGLRATFFLQGRWVEAYPETARRIVRDGHAVGNHSFFHARMPLLSDDGIRADVGEATGVIEAITGADPRPWFRCPFGTGWKDPRVREVLERLGYRQVGWDALAYDWEPDRTAEDIVEASVNGVLSGNGQAVLLLHAWPDQTLEALPRLIDRLSAAGAEPAGLDELSTVPDAAEF